MYLFLKHLVDRYNIYFAYNPSKIDRDIHFSAVNFVIVAGFLLQLFVLFFAYLRSSKTRFLLPVHLSWFPVSIASFVSGEKNAMVVFLICATFFNGFLLFGRCCFGWFKGLSPIKYRVSFSIALSFALICCCSSTCTSFFF